MNFSPEAIEHMKLQHQKLRNVAAGQKLDLYHLSEQLTVQRARVYLQQGVMRRMGVMERCVERVFEIFPTDRLHVLTKEEQDDLTINLHAFVINVYGILDNIAWVCVLQGGFVVTPESRLQVGLYKKGTKPYLPTELATYIDQMTMRKWFDEYAKFYRDSAAHRIPPYIPPKAFTPEESEEYRTLEIRAIEALRQMDLDEHEALKQRQNALGRPVAYMALTLSEDDATPPVRFHPQVLCDWMTIQDLIEQLSAGLRRQLQLPKFNLLGIAMEKG